MDDTRRQASGRTDSDPSDDRMADILRGQSGGRNRLRDSLRDEATPAADDILGRLNALEFVDSMVGEVTDVPDRLGDYRVTGLLGRGGMGTVYEAFQESLEREVALKVLSPAFTADPNMRARFRSEARATASLHHQHIVPIYDFGDTGGMLFFAMEKVTGVSLDKHISAARRLGKPAMQPRDAAGRFAGVAEALFHAHRRGILHRDVKPGNLLVGPDGTLALADFGLSKMLGEASRNLTAGGAFLGTLSYAPPEQARGDQPVPASDLYSLGVTLFESITGELPLHGKTTESMLQAVLNGTPKRLRDVMPRAPKDLDAVLQKLLRKDPADRYTDGEELARDLRRVAEGEPVRIRRQPVWQRVWRKAKKNPDLTLTVVLAGVLAIVSLVLIVVNQRERQTSVGAQHTNHLQEAMIAASREGGSAVGPEGLLAALTGVELAPVRPEDEVLFHLDEAQRLRPDDGVADALRRAYFDDPLPEATRLLREGMAFRARTLLDSAIDDAAEGFETRDNATWLRLYRFYLMRAVACLSSSVGELEQAKMDLFAASFVRSGAFFPKLLLVFVDWTPEAGTDALVDGVHAVLEDAPDGADVAAGVLMRAFAGVDRPRTSNMVRFAMPYGHRRALHEAAIGMLDAADPGAEIGDTTSSWTGLEYVLSDLAADAVNLIGNRRELEPKLTEGFELLRQEVDPDAALQSWGFLFRMLSDPTEVVAGPVAWSGRQQVEGCINLLRLQPPSLLVTSLSPRMLDVVSTNKDQDGVVELRARLMRTVGTVADYRQAADAWSVNAPDDPDALLCRFEGLVMGGEVEAATFCAAELLQQTVDRAYALREVLRVLRWAEQRPGPQADAWSVKRRQFERYRRTE